MSAPVETRKILLDLTLEDAPRRAGGRPTLADDLRRRLADAIMGGELPPGSRLDEHDLAERYGMSRTPVREALRQLAAVGLAEYRPHRGVIVAFPEQNRIAEMFEVMAEMEALCARLAALRMDAGERREFEALHRRSLEHVREGKLDDYDAINLSFHSMLYRGTRNRFLEETTLSVRRRVQPFRRSQFRVLGRLANSFAEHDRIVEAVLRGDAQAAEAAMREHVGRVSVASASLIEGRRQSSSTDAASSADMASSADVEPAAD